jgi:poly(hydroxyalkanoate) depolymerase family esterase
MPILRSMLRLLALHAVLAFAFATTAHAQTEVTGFGTNPGNLRMFKHVPSGLPANAPLVVALHGCSLGAANYDDEPGWRTLANRWNFALLLPEQQSANNSSRCFNWFETGDTARGQGEALSIRQMVDRMKTDHGVDPARVYVTGLSAGGAMTAVMLATYPDVFAGGAIVAGIPYRCATSTSSAFGCMNPGTDLTPAAWGDRVRNAYAGYSGPRPIVSVWHGGSDSVVAPMNLTEHMQQWTNALGIDQIVDAEDSLNGYPHKVYKDAAGNARVETWLITGMAHGTPIDPGAGESQCGVAAAYILDANICSSYHIGHFWGLDDLDGTAPSVTLTAPADGSMVSGTVNLAATASDDIGIARVEFLRDGTLLGSDTTSPYAYAWDSRTTSDGAHVLQARAVDLVDNVGTSSQVRVTVQNGTGGGTPQAATFASEAANDGYVKANADGSSPAVGTLESSYGLAIGRGVDAKLNRTLLSFDTSSLPDGATVVSATVTLTYRSASGDPWSNPAGNTLLVDAQSGCVGTCVTQTTDYAAAMQAPGTAQVTAFTGGTRSSSAFGSAGLAAINRTGRTQLRLRFASAQTATHYLWVGNGAQATLRVEYLP